MARANQKTWIVPEGITPTELDLKVLEYQEKGFIVPSRQLIKTPEQI